MSFLLVGMLVYSQRLTGILGRLEIRILIFAAETEPHFQPCFHPKFIADHTRLAAMCKFPG